VNKDFVKVQLWRSHCRMCGHGTFFYQKMDRLEDARLAPDYQEINNTLGKLHCIVCETPLPTSQAVIGATKYLRKAIR